MVKRNVCFNPGPAAVPLDVLKIIQEELLDFKGTGMSILESSHRAKEYEAINDQVPVLVRELLGVGPNYQVLVMGGGASLQFDMIPMNYIPDGKMAAYVDTGDFANRALKECQIVAKAHVAFSSKEEKYRRVPRPNEIKYPEDVAYLHICTNNTIEGTQFKEFPDTGKVPLVADMSSEMMSRQLDYNRFSLIYAGAQKNLGVAGVTLVIIRDDFLATAKKNLPNLLAHKTYVDAKSLYNTPPVFAVYTMKLVLEWLKSKGGLSGIEKINTAKKDLLYGTIDAAPDFYKGTAEKSSRSTMNVTMRMATEELENKFIAEAQKEGLMGLKGHRSVGGIRFSIYNAVTLADIERTVDFMNRFRKAN
jgi:phosphoserine aminotransferase